MTTDLRSLLLECEINRTGPIEITPEGHRMIEDARNAAADPRDVEIARLRALVEAAYREAHAKGGEQATDFYRLPDEDADWAASDARKALGD